MVSNLGNTPGNTNLSLEAVSNIDRVRGADPIILIEFLQGGYLISRRFHAVWVRSLLVISATLLVAVPLLWYTWSQEQRVEVQIRAAINRGLVFLAERQRETGEFPTYFWFGNNQAEKKYVGTPFTASQLLHSLKFVDGGEVGHRIRERTIAYLLSQREPPGVWRYYGKEKAHLLSPDVDDTAQAWAALFEHGLAVNPEALEILKVSRTEAGLFNTWIGDPAEWIGIDSRDVDLVVNLNVLFLFALVGQVPPEVCQYIVMHTTSKAYHRGTVYYPSPLAYAYFLSRASADGGAACLSEAIPEVRSYVLAHQRPDGGWGDDLETALGVLTLLNTGGRGRAVQRGINALLARQGPDGGWALAPLYKGAVQLVYYGSRSLTTGFCLEALGKYLRT